MKKPYDIADITPPPAVEIAGSDNPHIAWRLVSDMVHSLGTFVEDDSETRDGKIMASLQMAKSLAPQDALEAQLIAQIVSSHNVASEALQRANRRGQTVELQAQALKQAAQFMKLFRDQIRTLTQYRGTPKQMREDAEQAAWEAKCEAERVAEKKAYWAKVRAAEAAKGTSNPPA